MTAEPARAPAALHRELSGRGHPRVRPGVDEDAPGGQTPAVPDPFGRWLRFAQPG